MEVVEKRKSLAIDGNQIATPPTRILLDTLTELSRLQKYSAMTTSISILLVSPPS
jgi:hypothetical protein